MTKGSFSFTIARPQQNTYRFNIGKALINKTLHWRLKMGTFTQPGSNGIQSFSVSIKQVENYTSAQTQRLVADGSLAPAGSLVRCNLDQECNATCLFTAAVEQNTVKNNFSTISTDLYIGTSRVQTEILDLEFKWFNSEGDEVPLFDSAMVMSWVLEWELI